MQVTAYPQGRVNISSGTVILGASQNVLELAVEDLRFIFTFTAGVGEARAETFASDPKTVSFSLTNFESPLGISYELPDIATINYTSVSIVLFIHANSSAPICRMVSYTLTSAAPRG